MLEENSKKVLCIEDENFISELYARALREVQYLHAGVDWKRAVYMHRTGDETIVARAEVDQMVEVMT